MTNELQLRQFIDSHVQSVESLARQVALADWELQRHNSEEARVAATELTSRLSRVYADREKFEFLASFPVEMIQDPLLARQHTILHNGYLAGQIEETVIDELVRLEIDVEDRFNRYRAEVNGHTLADNDIDRILAESHDVELRRQVWEASKRVGAEVEESVLRLVRLRNRVAERLGFSNHFHMGLTVQEIDEAELFKILEDIARQSEPLWGTYKTQLDSTLCREFSTDSEQLRPWHYGDRFFQEARPGDDSLDAYFEGKPLQDLAANFFDAINLPVRDVIERSDLFEREGKCQHAFCLDIDRAGDVRILCNIRSNERWMDTILHELGHAAYDKYHDPNLPYVLREPAHTLTTEAIALFMGRLSKSPDWLARYAGLPSEEARRISGSASKQARDNLLVFTRWCLVVTNFERGLYTDPGQDLNALWWDLVERYQGVKRPHGRSAPDWAAKIHLATTPVYYHNYLLGETIASQLLHYLKRTVLAGEPDDAFIASPKVGGFMREQLFHPGAVRRWDAWLENATGEKLDPMYFITDLGST